MGFWKVGLTRSILRQAWARRVRLALIRAGSSRTAAAPMARTLGRATRQIIPAPTSPPLRINLYPGSVAWKVAAFSFLHKSCHATPPANVKRATASGATHSRVSGRTIFLPWAFICSAECSVSWVHRCLHDVALRCAANEVERVTSHQSDRRARPRR